MFASVLLALLAAGSALALPATRTTGGGSECDASKATITLPASQPSGTPLATPIAAGPSFVAIAIGVQNYTCGSTGTYTNVGALAELFDLSCFPDSWFNGITDVAWNAWRNADPDTTAANVISTLAEFDPPFVLGQHYFITNPVTGSGLSPKWDFTSASEAGHPDAYVVGARTGDIPAPTDPTVNIDWLSLSNLAGSGGDLADQVFRIQTRGGQPPASCTSGSAEIFVRYAAQYWFYGGSY